MQATKKFMPWQYPTDLLYETDTARNIFHNFLAP